MVRNRFHKTAEFQDILLRLTLEKEANRSVENSKKIVIFTTVCCHGNSLRYTHMIEKEIPGLLLVFTVNARSVNPKLKQTVHF